jgi:hypothetical protein
MEKCCKQCGIILCDKNWIIRKKLILNKCKTCINKAKSCEYKYDTIELEKLSSEVNTKITIRIDRKKHHKIKSLKRKEKREKKENYYIEYIAQYKYCIKCNKSKPINKFILTKYSKKLKRTGKNISRNYRLINCTQCITTVLRNQLSTGYVCKMLNLKVSETPQELVELKKQQLKLYREYHNKPNRL